MVCSTWTCVLRPSVTQSDIFIKRNSFLTRSSRTKNSVVKEDSEHTIKIIEERLDVSKSVATTGSLSVKKKIEERIEPIVATLQSEGYTIERIPKSEVVDKPPEAIKHDGDRIVISVVEERLVVEKRLFLVEEIHLVKHTVATEFRDEVSLRKEVVDVVRNAPSD